MKNCLNNNWKRPKAFDSQPAKVCMEMISNAATCLNSNTIRRCWYKSTILPAPLAALINNDIDRKKTSMDEDVEDLCALMAENMGIHERKDLMMDMFPDIDSENLQQSLMEACSTEKRAPVDEEIPDDDAILKVATSRASVLHFKEQKNDKSCRKVTDESMATIEKSISGRSKRQMDIKAFLSTG